MKVKPLYSLVCDDIRMEDSGKHIIIGAYNGDIVVQSFPVELSLATWTVVRLDYKKGDKLEPLKLAARMRISYENEALEPDQMTAELAIDPVNDIAEDESPDTLELPQRGAKFSVHGPATLVVEFRNQSGKWIEVAKKEISEGEPD